MSEKLAVLCAKAIARDRTNQGWSKLQYIFEAAVPTSVYSALLAWLPLNRLIQCEYYFPDEVLLEEWWRKLCDRCAQKDAAFKKKLLEVFEDSERKQTCRELLISAYFEEVLCSCCDAETPQDRPHALQDALGNCRHNIPTNDILAILAKHTTELILVKKRISRIQNLIESDSSCFGRIRCLTVDTCEYHGTTMRRDPVSASNWIFCIGHMLFNSNIEVISATRCCKFFGDAIQSSLNDERWVTNSLLANEDEVGDDQIEPDFEESDSMIDDEPRLPANATVSELNLLSCSVRHLACDFSGLEFLYNLEKLSVTCNQPANSNNMNFDPVFPSVTKLLLKRVLPQLQYLRFAGLKMMSLKTILTLGKYFREANNYEKDILLENISVLDQPKESFVDPIMFELENSPSHVASLAVSGLLTKPDYDYPSHAPVFEFLLVTFNPKHLLICCDGRRLDSLAPYFGVRDSDVNETSRIRLRKVTVVYQTFEYDDNLYRRRRSLSDILRDLIAVLRSEVHSVDVCVFGDEGKAISEDSSYLFRTFESRPMKKPETHKKSGF